MINLVDDLSGELERWRSVADSAGLGSPGDFSSVNEFSENLCDLLNEHDRLRRINTLLMQKYIAVCQRLRATRG